MCVCISHYFPCCCHFSKIFFCVDGEHSDIPHGLVVYVAVLCRATAGTEKVGCILSGVTCLHEWCIAYPYYLTIIYRYKINYYSMYCYPVFGQNLFLLHGLLSLYNCKFIYNCPWFEVRRAVLTCIAQNEVQERLNCVNESRRCKIT